MYRLIIADDEANIRKGLRLGIDWNAIGFSVVADFDNGEKVIEYLKSNAVDVVLSDVKMSVKSGLDIAKFLQEQKSKTKIVLISGFQEFEIARKSIEYSVERYLLKPLNTNEIKDVFLGIKASLDSLNEEKNKSLEEKENIIELLNYSKANWLQDIYFGVLTDEDEINKNINLFYGVNSPSQLHCFVLNILIKNTNNPKHNNKYGQEAVINGICNLISNMGKTEVYNISYKNAIALFIGVLVEEPQFSKKFEKYISKLPELALELLNIEIEVRESEYYENIKEMSNSNMHLDFSNGTKNIQLNKIEEYKKMIYTSVTLNEYYTAKKLVKKLLERLENSPLWFNKALVLEIANEINRIFSGFNFDTTIDTYKYLNNIMNSQTDKNLIETLLFILDFYSTNIIETTLNQQDKMINKAISYIELNYNNELSLNIIANQLYVNKSYLCRLFKEKTGSNLTDYLINVRINKAVELLNNNANATTIYEKVGYTDSRYFSRLFRSKTGYSLSEYAKNIKN